MIHKLWYSLGVVLLGFGFLVSGDGKAWSQEPPRAIKDYFVVCDDANNCWAKTPLKLVKGDASDAYHDIGVIIRRDSAPGSRWVLSLFTGVRELDLNTPGTITIDDSIQFTLRPVHWAQQGLNATTTVIVDSALATALLDAMLKGTAGVVTFSETDGSRRTGAFSLSGLTAALLWIDEKQGRIGAPRAAGHGPVQGQKASVPPSGSFAERTYREAVSDELFPKRLIALHLAMDCEAPSESRIGERPVMQGMLDDDNRLLALPCWSGAYNTGWNVFVIDRSGQHFSHIAFPRFTSLSGWSARSTLVNPTFDARSRTLVDHDKARGIGDCGRSGEYVWRSDNSGNAAFRLKRMRQKDNCDGVIGAWPVVFEDAGF